MTRREQWSALSPIAKGAVVGSGIGAVLGLGLLLQTWAAYQNRPAEDMSAEVIEGGLLMATLLGFPTSLALVALAVFGVGGWYVFILLAPLLNGTLVGSSVGAIWMGIRRLVRGPAR